jgi:hypothetical protein
MSLSAFDFLRLLFLCLAPFCVYFFCTWRRHCQNASFTYKENQKLSGKRHRFLPRSSSHGNRNIIVPQKAPGKLSVQGPASALGGPASYPSISLLLLLKYYIVVREKFTLYAIIWRYKQITSYIPTTCQQTYSL